MSISLDDLSDSDQQPKDFRRANGAPMVKRLDGSGKWDRYSRPSSMGGELDDESRLVNWKIDRAMDGTASTPSIAAAVVAKLGQKDDRKELREKAIQAGRGEEAADLGTALHAITERWESEGPYPVPPPYDADVAAYLATLDELGLVSEYIEVKICSDPWRAAGTADRLYRATKPIYVGPQTPPIEPGQLVLADLKTGKSLDYSFRAFSVQLAIYSDGCFYNVETDERTQFPMEMRTDVALLVHLPAGQGQCELHWVDLEVGREGAEIVKQVRAWRKRTDQVFPFVQAPPTDAEILEEAAGPDVASAHPGTWPTDDETWVDAMIPYCQRRINDLGRFSNEARNFLLRRWPEGVRPFAVARPAPLDVTQVLELLDYIEGLYSVPWPVDDPRVEWNRSFRGSNGGIRTNLPPSQIEWPQTATEQ